jgi:hypothetical protein
VETQNCSICKTELMLFERYPKYICESCAKKATDLNGRSIEFGNTNMFGGCIGYYKDTKELYPYNSCYVDGIECKAEEARFGGIVIQKVEKNAIIPAVFLHFLYFLV